MFRPACNLVLCVIFFLACQPSHCHRKVEIVSKLVQDLIRSENVSSILSAKTCWSKWDDVYLFKNTIVPIQLINQFNQSEWNCGDVQHRNRVWYFVDMDCVDSYEFLSMVDIRCFAHPYRWILLDPIWQLLNTSFFLPDSNVILANLESNHRQYNLFQIYQIEKNSPNYIRELFGYWSYENGIEDARSTRIISRRRRNLMGKLFTASMVILFNDSLNHLDDYHDSHIDAVSKTSYMITSRLIESVNGTVQYMPVNTWGYKDPKTGIYTGLSGHLQLKQADIGATVLFMTTDRIPLIEYLAMTTPTKAVFVLRAPPLSYVSNIYYLPFAGIVWVCTIALVLISTTVIFFTYKHPASGIKQVNFNFSDFLLLAIGTICQMGTHLKPKIISGKLSTFFFCIAFMFIYTSYTANIVALLQSTTKKINTLEDLLHSTLDFGIEDTPYTRFYFPAATDPIRKALYETKINVPKQPSKFMNMSYGISQMRKGLFVFHMEIGNGYRQIQKTFYENEKCGLIQIPFLTAIYPWYGIQKHSPYKEILKTNIFKLREHGIQGRENAKIYIPKPVCGSNGQNFGSVRLIDCYAAMLVLLYGYLASILVLVLERISERTVCCTRQNNEVEVLS